MKRYDLNATTCAFLGLLLLFFGLFLFYPVGLMLKRAFVSDGKFTLEYFGLLLSSPLQRESLANSFAIATLTTALTTLVTLPLAHVMTRVSFRGRFQHDLTAPRLISFAVLPEDEAVIEAALALASAGLSGANRRGRALAVICEHFVDGPRA